MRLACIVLSLLVSGAASAADYWVATTGNDAGAGTKEAPFRTIARAVKELKPGDTAFVKAGRYEENVSVGAEHSGEPDKWVTIAAAPGDERRAVVGTEKPLVDGFGAMQSAFALQQVKYVRLRGLFSIGVYRGRGSAIGINKSEHVEVLNCVAMGGGQGGVDANHCNHVTIDGVEAYFNGGGSGWSSGISLLELTTKDNVVRNCICYGNTDDSSWQSDGNGIIIDNAYELGGALVANNLCYQNGGKGISSTRSDDCVFLNNTCVGNCMHPAQQATAHEMTVRGARNVVRNNICVSRLPKGVGMAFLDRYTGPKGQPVVIDPKTVTCDHNLFFSTRNNLCVRVLGNRATDYTLDQLAKAMPEWSAGMLGADPRFNNAGVHAYYLLPGSPALAAGVTHPEAPADLLGAARTKGGACSLGCYEGPHPEVPGQITDTVPHVAIGGGEDQAAIEALLANRYDFDWHGMLWGFGHLLSEELPLVADVQLIGRQDYVDVVGSFTLKDLLEKLKAEHGVYITLRQPAECRGLATTPNVISRRLVIRPEADEAERAFVRKMLRMRLATDDPNGRFALADLLPALSASLSLGIDGPVPKDAKFVMITRNMPLGCALTDLADRMNVTFTLSRRDPFADAAKVTECEFGKPFGSSDGVAEMTVDQPDGRGRAEIFARVGAEGTLCARAFSDNSRLVAPPALDSKEAGPLFHKADTHVEKGSVVRFAVVGKACALNVGGGWVLLNEVPAKLTGGTFLARGDGQWFKLSHLRFVPVGN